MIARIWRGYTSAENADEYETVLRDIILPGIQRLSGYRGSQLLRRFLEDEVEFVTITYFTDINAVVAFAGEYFTKAVIEKQAETLLTRFDGQTTIYDLVSIQTGEDFFNM